MRLRFRIVLAVLASGVLAADPNPLVLASADDAQFVLNAACLARGDDFRIRLVVGRQGPLGGSLDSVEFDPRAFDAREAHALVEDLTSALARPYVPSRCKSTTRLTAALEVTCGGETRATWYGTHACDGASGEGYHAAFGLLRWAQRLEARNDRAVHPSSP